MFKLSNISLLLLAALVVVAPAQDKEKFKFKVAQPKKDTRFVNAANNSVDFNMDVSMNGQSVMQMVMKSKEKSIREHTVLAVDDKGITKMRYTLKQFESSQSMQMMGQNQDESESDARLGSTFIVEIRDGKIAVTDEEGAEAGPDIVAAFEVECGDEIGKGRLHDPTGGMDNMVGGRELAIDDVVNMNEEMVREMMEGAEDQMNDVDIKIDKATLTLIRKVTYLGTECGVFKAEMKLAGKGEEEGLGMGMNFDMSGEFFIGIDNCWLYKMEMSGPMTVNGGQSTPDGDIAMDGKGDIKTRQDVAVGQAGK